MLDKTISGLDTSNLVSVAHLSMSMLRHRLSVSPFEFLQRMPAAEMASQEEIVHALRVVRQIERLKSKPLDEFSEAEVQHFVGVLARLVDRQLSRESSGAHRGETLLEELRNAPSRTAGAGGPVARGVRDHSRPRKISSKELTAIRSTLDYFMKRGRHSDALPLALEIAQADPRSENLHRVGILYGELSNHRMALRYLQRALRCKGKTFGRIGEIHLQRAYSWYMLGRSSAMRRALRQAYAAGMRPRMAPQLHLALGNYYYSRKEYRRAIDEYHQAERTARNEEMRGRASAALGLVFIRMRDLMSARRHLLRAEKLQKRLGNTLEFAKLKAMLALVSAELGHSTAASRQFAQAAVVFRKLGRHENEARALTNAGIAASYGLDWRKSLPFLDRSIEMAMATMQSDILVMALAARAWVLVRNDNFESAQKDLSRARRLLKANSSALGRVHLARSESSIALYFCKWREACKRALRAQILSERLGEKSLSDQLKKIQETAKRQKEGERKHSPRGVGKGRTVPHLSSEVLERLKALAVRESPILIVGELGTGKTEAARLIHGESRRAHKPLVFIPCDQLTSPAAELVGHVRGAWSGAVNESIGLVKKAKGGTLVLDRLDELDPEGQRMLVPILEGRVRPIGSSRFEDVNVRFIATCRDPQQIIPSVRARLSHSVLNVPPLRDRRNEIAQLAQSLIRGRREITCDALASMSEYEWPGNFLELGAMVERLVVGSDYAIGTRDVRQVLSDSPQLPRGVRSPVVPIRHRWVSGQGLKGNTP